MLFRRPASRAAAAGSFNFEQGVREVLARARGEAARLAHEFVGPEHVLLAIASPDVEAGARVLAAAGIDARQLRERIEGTVGRGTAQVGEDDEIPYTSRAKKLLELAMTAARDRGDGYVGVEHLLVGIVREERSHAAQLLAALGVTEPRVWDAMARLSAALGASALRVAIDDRSDRSIFEQIVAQIQEAIATGTLREGARLPTVRRLADDLDVAPGTVARAYAELERRGVVVTEGARGTRVAPRARPAVADEERPAMLVGLLRPVAVAAFHLGASSVELRDALDAAMRDIYERDAAKGEGR